MASQLDATKREHFESIARFPDLKKMLDLSPQDFEQFVGFVFTSAGYAVEHVGLQHFPEGPGVDFNLYLREGDERPVARIEVRRYKPSNLLNTDAVMAFIGKLHVAEGIPGFMVTTSDFNGPARQAAHLANGLVRLINGERLLRYIAYIGGSVFMDETGLRRTPTQVSPDYIIEADSIARRDPAKTRIVTVANNRGGIGKTTAALNLGFALAQQGRRVLLIDMDGQSSLTAALPLPSEDTREPRGAPPPVHQHTLAEYFSGQTKALPDLVQPTRFDHLWLLPAHPDLHRMDSGGGAHPDKELAFVRALHDPQVAVPPKARESGGFEWIILDTPPAQTYYARAALAACHYMLIPIAVEAFAVRGVTRVADTVTAMHGLVGNGVDILGCAITNWRPNAAAERERQNLATGLDAMGIHLFDQKIPYDANINTAHITTVRGGLGSLFRLHANPSPAAKAYLELLKAVKGRIADVDKHHA